MNCRLLSSGFSDGFFNMAVDGALLRSCAGQASAPALRFYGWEPPAVSVGYFQDADDFRALPGFSEYDIVKRLTGGGAILHDRELTFSLVCREKDGLLPEDVLLSYGAVCRALIAGLAALGISARTRGGSSPGSPVSGVERKSPYFCFEKPSGFDVVASGRKLAGSAQRRSGGAVLHHGSILLGGGRAEGSVSVEEAAGKPVSFNELSAAVLEGFKEVLGAEFAEGGLTGFEADLVNELLETKYRRRGKSCKL